MGQQCTNHNGLKRKHNIKSYILMVAVTLIGCVSPPENSFFWQWELAYKSVIRYMVLCVNKYIIICICVCVCVHVSMCLCAVLCGVYMPKAWVKIRCFPDQNMHINENTLIHFTNSPINRCIGFLSKSTRTQSVNIFFTSCHLTIVQHVRNTKWRQDI